MSTNYVSTIRILNYLGRITVRARGIASDLSRGWRVAILAILLASMALVTAPTVRVKGLLVNTGLHAFEYYLSIDAGRITFQTTPTTFGTPSPITVFDTNSGTSITFNGPAGGGTAFPLIFGDKIVVIGDLNDLLTSTIYYCDLPRVVPLQPCGPWEIVEPAHGYSYFAAWGFPTFQGNIIVWAVTNGIRVWWFSNETGTTVPYSVQPYAASTNGELVAFIAKSAGSSSHTLRWFDTSSGSTVVDTGLPAGQYMNRNFTIHSGVPRQFYRDLQPSPPL